MKGTQRRAKLMQFLQHQNSTDQIRPLIWSLYELYSPELKGIIRTLGTKYSLPIRDAPSACWADEHFGDAALAFYQCLDGFKDKWQSAQPHRAKVTERLFIGYVKRSMANHFVQVFAVERGSTKCEGSAQARLDGALDNHYQQHHGRGPCLDELAYLSELPLNTVHNLLLARWAAKPLSLSSPLPGSDDLTLDETLADPNGDGIDHTLLELKALPAEQRAVVSYRAQGYSYADLTLHLRQTYGFCRSPKAWKTYHNRALSQLRRRLLGNQPLAAPRHAERPALSPV